MKVVIVGYGEMLEAACLGILESKHDIAGVFRHDNIIFNKLKRILYDFCFPSSDLRLVKNLYIYDIKANSVNSNKFRNEIKRLNADVIITASWSEKFSQETINTPKIAVINIHPSLLPKYRGPNPYFRTILANEQKTGVTFHLMNEKFDSGNIISQYEILIDGDETGQSLKFKCTNAVKNNISDVLNNLNERIKNSITQDEASATYQPQITLKEAILDFENNSSYQIDTRIRALKPWLNSYIPYKNEFLSFKSYKILENTSEAEAGTIIDKTCNSITIVCNDKKCIKFSSVNIIKPFSCLLSKLYLKYFIKINSKAV